MDHLIWSFFVAAISKNWPISLLGVDFLNWYYQMKKRLVDFSQDHAWLFKGDSMDDFHLRDLEVAAQLLQRLRLYGGQHEHEASQGLCWRGEGGQTGSDRWSGFNTLYII